MDRYDTDGMLLDMLVRALLRSGALRREDVRDIIATFDAVADDTLIDDKRGAYLAGADRARLWLELAEGGAITQPSLRLVHSQDEPSDPPTQDE